MKKLFLLLFIAGSSFLRAQEDYSPSFLKIIDFILQGNAVPYTGIISLEPSAAGVDTVSILSLDRAFNEDFLGGYEYFPQEMDSILWRCQVNGNANTVSLIEPMFPMDTLQKEVVYADAQGRDTAFYIYSDTGNARLDLTQIGRPRYRANGDIEGIDILGFVAPGAPPVLNASYSGRFNAQGRLDSILINFVLQGFPIPVQLFTYHYNASNLLDSVNVIDPLANTVVEQFRPQYNSLNQIERFGIYERDENDEWVPYNTIVFVPAGGLGLSAFAEGQPRFYPNPAREELILEAKAPGQVEIIDSQGRVQLKADLTAGKNRLNIQALAPGAYFLRWPERNTGNQALIVH